MNWQEAQYKTFKKFTETGNPFGIFSYEGLKSAISLGEILKQFKGNCLDVGCGMLEKPVYMVDNLEWYGIDPLDDRKRDFKFTKGIAEKLPYKDDSFDNVLFATSLDHIEDTKKAVKEAKRVLKKGGNIIVWQFVVPELSYLEWKKKGGWANEHHPVCFSHKSIVELFEMELVFLKSIAVAENVYVFKDSILPR